MKWTIWISILLLCLTGIGEVQAQNGQAARDYVEYVEKAIGCHITYVSVGPARDSIIIR